jgi:hypothetical protein
MDLGHGLREIGRHGMDAEWWRKRFLTHVVSRYYEATGAGGTVPVVAEDWDTLIVLDACRYDLFEALYRDYDLSGSLEKRTAMGTGTPAFLRANFAGGTFHDTVYVTANPYVATELDEAQFHAVESIWRDGWDDDLQTVRPETVATRALTAAERYPDKRLVVHFLQPHAPFIGERRLGERESFAIRRVALGETGATRRGATPFERLARGELSRETVWNAYADNLAVAMPVLERLLDSLPGRTAVTADHGNAFGERAEPFSIRVYGHPLGVMIPALTDVPWFVSDNGERRAIRAAAPTETRTDADERSDGPSRSGRSDDRLRALGYLE